MTDQRRKPILATETIQSARAIRFLALNWKAEACRDDRRCQALYLVIPQSNFYRFFILDKDEHEPHESQVSEVSQLHKHRCKLCGVATAVVVDNERGL